MYIKTPTNCRDCSDDLAQLEFVEDGGLTGGIQPNHQDPHLLLSKKTLEKGGEQVSHGAGFVFGGVLLASENNR